MRTCQWSKRKEGETTVKLPQLCPHCGADITDPDDSLFHTRDKCLEVLQQKCAHLERRVFDLLLGKTGAYAVRPESSGAPRDEPWRRYEPLFLWRDLLTDRWGNDLIALLAGLGGPIDHRLPSEHVSAWEAFGKLDESTRWAHAKAFVRATEPAGLRNYEDDGVEEREGTPAESEHHFHNDAERGSGEDEEDEEGRGDPMKVRIEHDDQPEDILEKINEVLKRIGFELKHGAGGDGFVVYKLSPVAVTAK